MMMAHARKHYASSLMIAWSWFAGARAGWALAAAALGALSAGCAQEQWRPRSWFARKPAPASQPQAAAAAPAGEPAATAPAPASQPEDATADLANEVQRYISNLPLDDLQQKLARHEQPAAPMPARAGTVPEGPAAQAANQPPQHEPQPMSPPAVTMSAAASGPGPAPLDRPTTPAAQAPPTAAGARAQPAGTTPPNPAGQPTRIVDVEISPAVLASLPARSEAPVEPVANRPISTGDGSTSAELKALLEQLRQAAAQRPDSLGAALRVRMAQWLLDDAGSPGDWPLQDAQKRRLAESVWRVLQLVAKADATPPGAPPEAFQQAIDGLVGALEEARPLQIPNALLCRSVSSFGYYEALAEPWKFPAGRTNMVVLYCELTGFASEPTQAQPAWYHALLGQRLAILTADGREIWSHEDPEVEDLCRRPRRDFFITKLLKIPAELPAGHYVLKATIRDLLGNRVAETNLPFEMVAGM